MSPIAALFRSRKFLIFISDVFFSTLLYFVGKYAVPGVAEDINFLVAVLQPGVLILIAAIAYEDVQAKRAGNFCKPSC